MSKKKTLLIAVCAALMMIGAATMAYFTDQESATNTFTVGKVDIELYEMNVDAEGKNSSGYSQEGNEYKLIPGNTYDKEAFIRVTGSSEPCWLFVTVDNQIADIEGAPTIENQMTEKSFWEPIDAYMLDGKTVAVYAWDETVAPSEEGNATDVVIFKTFTINGDVADNAAIAASKDKVIDIKAYAVQAAGFDTAKAAWDATFGQ